MLDQTKPTIEEKIKWAIGTKLCVLAYSKDDDKLIIVDTRDRKGDKSFGLNQVKEITKVNPDQDNISRYFFEGRGCVTFDNEDDKVKSLTIPVCNFKGYAIVETNSNNEIEIDIENNTITLKS